MIYSSQGFNDVMSLLGMELWGKMLKAMQEATATLDIDGTIPMLHGRIYMNVSYIYKALGTAMGKQYINAIDNNVTKIFDNLYCKKYYMEI